MAIKRNLRRRAPQMDELLARFELINAERSLLGLPRVDPFDGLDLSVPAVDAFGGASFGSLAPSPPRRAQNTLGGGSGNGVLIGGAGSDTLALLDGMIFDDDPVGGVSFGSLAPSPPVRNPLRAPGPIIGSGGASADELMRQDDIVADQDEILDGRPVILPGFKTQSQHQGLAAREKRRRRRPRGIAQERQELVRQGLAFLDGIIFDDDPVGLQSSNVPPPERRLRQPSHPQQRVAPGDATPANDVPDLNIPFALSGAPPAADARPPVNPRQVSTVLDRLLNAAGRRAARALASGGELGLSPGSVRFFRQLGLLADPAERSSRP